MPAPLPGVVEVIAAGVDTWSPCWYVDPGCLAAGMLDELATVPTKRGRLMREPVGGHRVVWSSSTGLLYAEGHPDPEGLCAPAALPAAFERLVGELLAANVPLPNGRSAELWTGDGVVGSRFDGFAGLRRVDLALDVRTGSTAEGLALLAGVAAVPPPGRLAVDVRREPGGRSIETVSLHGTTRKLARIYDKATESNLAPRAQIVRFEGQHAYPRETRRVVEDFSPSYSASTFERRFHHLWRASEGVKVVTLSNAALKIREAVVEGRITAGQGIDAAGHLLLEAHGVEVGSRPTRWRHQSIVRDLGLVVADADTEPIEVDLHEVLERVLETDAWGREG